MTVQTRVHFDNDGRMIFERIQDVEQILDANRADQTWGTHRTPWGRKIADIPCVVVEKWMNEEGADVLKMSGPEFGQFIRRKLRDPDNAKFRTVNGRV